MAGIGSPFGGFLAVNAGADRPVRLANTGENVRLRFLPAGGF
jgi:hypothetical protein